MKIEMKGKKFGRWTVIKESGRDSSRAVLWECVCDCGERSIVKGYSLRSGVSKSCGCLHREYAKTLSGEKNPHWRGGSYVNDSGYVMVYDPEHERASTNGYVREHIVIAEAALGKKLPPSSQVHHFGDASDNTKIVVCEDQKYHFLLHIRQRALNDCGDANKRMCKFCKEYDFIGNLYLKQRPGGNGWSCYHRKCSNEYDKNRRIKKRLPCQK